MSFFYCVLSASGLHHPVDDGRQAAYLTGLPAQVVRHRAFLAHHEVRFHLALALDGDRTSEFRLVAPVHQDLHKGWQNGRVRTQLPASTTTTEMIIYNNWTVPASIASPLALNNENNNNCKFIKPHGKKGISHHIINFNEFARCVLFL